MNNDLPRAASQLSYRLRLAGIIVLVIGLAGAGLVYWQGTRKANSPDNASMLQYDKPTEHQMQMLYGKQGQLIEDLSNSLKQPGTQAILIIAVTAVIAGVCFRIAALRKVEP